jgi:phosphatidylglycerophosphatase A
MGFAFFRSAATRREHSGDGPAKRARVLALLRDGGGRDRLAVIVATCGGLGFLPRPGGSGALVGAGLAWAASGEPALSWAALAAVTLAGTAAVARVGAAAGVEDPGAANVDEVAGAWLACLLSGLSGPWLLVPTALFLVADRVKPWPANALEARGGAAGVMGDDLVAGIWAGLLSLGTAALMTGAG